MSEVILHLERSDGGGLTIRKDAAIITLTPAEVQCLKAYLSGFATSAGELPSSVRGASIAGIAANGSCDHCVHTQLHQGD